MFVCASYIDIQSIGFEWFTGGGTPCAFWQYRRAYRRSLLAVLASISRRTAAPATGSRAGPVACTRSNMCGPAPSRSGQGLFCQWWWLDGKGPIKRVQVTVTWIKPRPGRRRGRSCWDATTTVNEALPAGSPEVRGAQGAQRPRVFRTADRNAVPAKGRRRLRASGQAAGHIGRAAPRWEREGESRHRLQPTPGRSDAAWVRPCDSTQKLAAAATVAAGPRPSHR